MNLCFAKIRYKMTRECAAVCFEYRLRENRVGWEIVVMWNHSLRERIHDLIFGSEQEAVHWIGNESTSWVARENEGITRRADGPQKEVQWEHDYGDVERARKAEIKRLNDALAQLFEKIDAVAAPSRSRCFGALTKA